MREIAFCHSDHRHLLELTKTVARCEQTGRGRFNANCFDMRGAWGTILMVMLIRRVARIFFFDGLITNKHFSCNALYP